MVYAVSIATSVVSAMLVFILQMIIRENHRIREQREKEMQEKIEAYEEGLQALLRDKLIYYHAKYTQRGHISTNGLENGTLMYDAYKKLGGNGMIDQMANEIRNLPVRD